MKQCQICIQAKPERVTYPGLLQPLPVPEGAWQVIYLDFIEGMPTSHKYNCILVVVDKFSKYAHFVPLTHPYTALKVATQFMKHVYKLHGIPELSYPTGIGYSLANCGAISLLNQELNFT